ncbi:YjcZ family sporulation protein [Salipaludibacillus agaradhaerens]|nr:YjcZ family sporulation protein [Salipaludibacillus agaradhaerens]MCR6110776.1 YjcZ family sporulation protein [Bacillus sp. A301a_S52]MCR6118734.1 YjcZ family sporulation protein [Salipaludibacillus agaradhaerens]UJW59735.1 YjcZ family sporulation protein [Bacillus sp. A116_S68]
MLFLLVVVMFVLLIIVGVAYKK